MKHGKKYIDSKKLIDPMKSYEPAEAIELLKGVGVSFYEIDIDSLKEAYAAKVEADGTTYDEAWVAAVDAARAAVK